MLIGIDARELHSPHKTDIQRQMKGFLSDFHQSHYQDECVLFSQQPLNEFESDKIHNCVLSSEFTFIWEHFLLSLALKRYDVNVFYSPYIDLPLLIGGKKICSVENVDSLKELFMSSLMASKFLAQAHAIIVRSQEVKEQLMQEYQCGFEKLKVIPHSIEDIYFQEQSKEKISEFLTSHQLSQPYIFYRSLHSSKDKIELSLKALLAWVNDALDMNLVIELSDDKDLQWFKSTFPSFPSHKVRIFSLRDDQQRLLFYQGAWACFVDFEKGIFPIAMIEAMASGSLVVAPSYPVVLEVMAGAGLCCDMTSVENITQVIDKIAKTPFFKQDLQNRASLRSKDFDQRRLSNKLYDVFRQTSWS